MDRWNVLLVVGTFASVFLSLLIVLSGTQGKAAQEKARGRRMAEHRMNARLLRLDI